MGPSCERAHRFTNNRLRSRYAGVWAVVTHSLGALFALTRDKDDAAGVRADGEWECSRRQKRSYLDIT